MIIFMCMLSIQHHYWPAMKRLLFFLPAVCCLTVAFAWQSIPSIPGWKTESSNGHYLFKPITLFNSKPTLFYELMPLAATGDTDQAAWLKDAATSNLQQTGYTIPNDPSAMKLGTINGILTFTAIVFDHTQTRWEANYMLYSATDNKVRWARILNNTGSDNKKNLQTAVVHFLTLARQEGGLRPGNTTASTAGRETAGNAKQQAISPITTTPGKGLAPADVKGIVLVRHYGLYGPYFDSYLLLANGSIYKDTKPCPYDLNTALSRQTEPRKWGSWKIQGSSLIIQWNKENKPSVYEKNQWFWTQPAAANEKITGGFKALSVGGNTPVGGNIITFAASNIHFNSQGQFTLARSSGGSSPAASAYSSRDEGGSYLLNGYSIELRFNNGKVIRQSFYFYPGARDHFGIGGNDYVPEKT